jgi:uncharacterized protein YeaO (DUF488 family)
MIVVKRVYDPPAQADGFRVLVDRLWPRGLSRERARVDLWLREIAPSEGLRRWFAHDPTRWEEFRRRYREELKDRGELLRRLKGLEAEHGVLTLLYAARDREHNNAIVLREVLAEGW